MTIRILFGELRTGKITGQIDVTDCNWAQVLNDSGSIDQVVVPDDVIARLNLRQTAAAARCFLAVEIDDRIQEAGPIWSRVYDWKAGQVTLGAAGLWSLFDHRKVIPVLAAGQRVNAVTTTLTGADLGEIARGLVALAQTHVGGSLPLVLPTARPGTANTESFPGWSLLQLGDQLRQLTQRQSAAPDIAFRPRRKAADRRYIEWVMLTGTGTAPQLSQGGDDWVFDTTARKSPVVGIGADEDATAMGMRAWETGNGTEASTLISMAENDTLINLGWPLLEVEENRSTVEEQATLDGYAAQLLAQNARPVEVWTVSVYKEAAAEVQAGDYAVVKTKGHRWLGTGAHRMRVQKKSGDLTDVVVLTMYPLQAVL